MPHLICLIASLVFLLAAVAYARFLRIHPEKQTSLLTPLSIIIAGVFLSGVVMFLPLNHPLFQMSALSIPLTLLISIHSTIRLFIVDCDFTFISESTEALSPWLRNAYAALASVLYVVSPILTVGSVLSFVANMSARARYWMSYSKDKYVFSELNERSLCLATSFKKNDPSRLIVFTDVFNNKDSETSYELIERAKKLNAVLFKSDITVTNFKHHNKKKKLYFFIIGENEVENLKQTKILSGKPVATPRNARVAHPTYGYDYPGGDFRLFLFTINFNSERLLSSVKPDYIRVRRANDVQSLVYNLLNDRGMEIFESARETGNKVKNTATGKPDNEKKISAMIVGLGLHGTEMLKGLSWFCQMHPYTLEINAFDLHPLADSVLQSACPDLFDRNLPLGPAPSGSRPDGRPFHNGDHKTPGEAHYSIRIFPDQDVNRYEFDRLVSQLSDTTYVFVALGDDNLNVKISAKIRILLRRLGCNPVIHTILYNPVDKKPDPTYNIYVTGDIEDNYSEDCLLNSNIEKAALARHMEYVYKMIAEANPPLSEEEKQTEIRNGEDSFWNVDYNYRSSIASAIHTGFKKKLDIPGSNKKPADRTKKEKYFYQNMEHQRWNAYVRSEGYVWAPVRDKLAKTHHLLVPFEELPQSEKDKDDD